ncbi:MAG TPA: UDP-glucose 4-epimerase GalE [Alphaproteobacteria bacterium]|nr:UDP-glucose 4-epimerase GalE [Alphaproteobacteria bacterium]
MTKTILVTGGAGYVGSHACKRLAADGYVPVTLDNFSTGHRWAVRWGPLVEADIGDRAAVGAAIERHRPVAVMHFSALALVEESMREPALYYRNNVAATLSLLEAMRAAGLDKFVFSSSCAVYGVPERVPIAEDVPKAPINPYGTTKLMVECMLADFSRAYGLKALALRYFNAAGADPEDGIGEDHNPESHLIPRVLDAALGRAEGATVFGDDYPTPDGTCVRDYVHVRDLADAHVRGLEYLLAGGASAFLNLGTGHGYSVREVIEATRKVTGREFPVRHAPRRPGDPASLVADARAAQRTLAWEPRHSALETLIGDAWNWHRRHFAP